MPISPPNGLFPRRSHERAWPARTHRRLKIPMTKDAIQNSPLPENIIAEVLEKFPWEDAKTAFASVNNTDYQKYYNFSKMRSDAEAALLGVCYSKKQKPIFAKEGGFIAIKDGRSVELHFCVSREIHVSV